MGGDVEGQMSLLVAKLGMERVEALGPGGVADWNRERLAEIVRQVEHSRFDWKLLEKKRARERMND